MAVVRQFQKSSPALLESLKISRPQALDQETTPLLLVPVPSQMADSTSKFQRVIRCSMGLLSYKNGDKLRGTFRDGRPCGPGSILYQQSMPGVDGFYEDGVQYNGSFRAGRRDGEGTMTWKDGASFTGEWREDVRYYG